MGEHAHDVGFHMKWLSERIKQIADGYLLPLKLTYAQASVVFFLERCGGEATQKEIELYLQVAHPTTVGLVSRMERNGYVVFRPDQTDRRNKIVTMTDKAWQVVPEIQSVRASVGERVMQGISAEDRDRLSTILDVMEQNVSIPR